MIRIQPEEDMIVPFIDTLTRGGTIITVSVHLAAELKIRLI